MCWGELRCAVFFECNAKSFSKILQNLAEAEETPFKLVLDLLESGSALHAQLAAAQVRSCQSPPCTIDDTLQLIDTNNLCGSRAGARRSYRDWQQVPETCGCAAGA